MATAYLTAHRLRQLFHYSLITGEFYRKIRVAAHKAGGIAGSIRTDGYRSIKINGRSYFCHRLAWLWVNGDWPADEVDHINRNRANNAWHNLRAATSKQNSENAKVRRDNRSGVTGVCWCNQTSKWRVRIRHNGALTSLGFFSDFGRAVKARKDAEAEMFTHAR